MRKLFAVIAAATMLSTAAMAAQVTIGDWDFDGVDCFSGYSAWWAYNASPAENSPI